MPRERTGSRAEHDLIVSPTRARKCARWIILRITVRSWAPILEKFGKICRSTAPRIATIFIGLEYSTRVVSYTRLELSTDLGTAL